MLNEIWHVGRLGEGLHAQPIETILPNAAANEAEASTSGLAGRSWVGWWKLGLISDSGDEAEVEDRAHLLEAELFRDVGELGLECLVSQSASLSGLC
jgi:hypothetical protein